MDTTHQLDLKANRCPAAMIYVRRAIDGASSQEFTGSLTVLTIEPSMHRDLKQYVNAIDADVTISSLTSSALNEEKKSEWLLAGEAIDNELEGIENIHVFTLVFG
jgi:TusA-related sulfurtransferase